MMYKIELNDDEFEIIEADSNEEAIEEALDNYEIVFNVILIDENYDEIETIF